MSSRGGRGACSKGSKGESEVVRLWRAHGWTGAARSPGSGSLRPYPGDVSPWPGDLIGTGRWLVEVKRDERLAVPGRGGGWQGEAFVRRTARQLRSLAMVHAKANWIAPVPKPCLWARPNGLAWVIWVPAEVVVLELGAAYGEPPEWALEWVGLDVEEFFWLVAGPPEGRRR